MLASGILSFLVRPVLNVSTYIHDIGLNKGTSNTIANYFMGHSKENMSLQIQGHSAKVVKILAKMVTSLLKDVDSSRAMARK